jgi:hypothetical protein
LARGACGGVEEVFESEEFALADEGDDALMGVGLAVAGELVAGLGADANAFGAGELEDGIDAGVAAGFALAGDAEVVERAGAGAEGLFDGVQAVQNIHGFSVIGFETEEGSVPQDEAGGAAVGAKIEGVDVTLTLEALGGQLAAQTGLAVQEQDLIFILRELRHGGIELVELEVDGAREMAGFELRRAANVDEQTAALLVFAGMLERGLPGEPEVEVESHQHEEKYGRKYKTHGFAILFLFLFGLAPAWAQTY